MNALQNIISQHPDISFEPSYNGLKLILPFYHEDGDMYELFVKELEDDTFLIFDNGLSLMRLSYSFALDTEHKIDVFNRILKENYINNQNGNLNIKTDSKNFIASLNQICMTIAKVTNISILSKEVVSSLFYDYVDEYVMKEISPRFQTIKNYKPKNIEYFPPTYKIDTPNPIFLFPVKDSLSAARASNGCNQLKLENKKYSSVSVCDDLSSLNRMDMYFLMQTVDKVYPQITEFKSSFPEYIERFAS
jgi:hypothetical protein